MPSGDYPTQGGGTFPDAAMFPFLVQFMFPFLRSVVPKRGVMLDSPEEFKNFAAGIPRTHLPPSPEILTSEWGLGTELIPLGILCCSSVESHCLTRHLPQGCWDATGMPEKPAVLKVYSKPGLKPAHLHSDSGQLMSPKKRQCRQRKPENEEAGSSPLSCLCCAPVMCQTWV